MIVINELFTENPAPAVVAQGDSVASGRTPTNVKVKSIRRMTKKEGIKRGYTSCE